MAGIILDLRAIRKALDDTDASISLKTDLDRAIADLGRVATQCADAEAMAMFGNLDSLKPCIRRIINTLGRIN